MMPTLEEEHHEIVENYEKKGEEEHEFNRDKGDKGDGADP
jgi:hypothetical protein